ncbi:MAG: tetratricopeptide repeat protein [Rhodothermales bacterium]
MQTPALAQECSDPPDANEQAMNYSLYWESFKNKDYASSLPYLKWILKCAPAYQGPGKLTDKNFERAEQLYEALAAEASDQAMVRALLDTALYYFDTAPAVLQEVGADFSEAEWILNKGRFIQKHAAELPDLQGEVGGLYRSVYETEPSLLSPRPYYINVIITDFASQDMKQEAIDFMENVESQFGDDAETMQIVADWRNRLFDNPEERMAFLETQLEKNPGDEKIIDELIDIYKELEERDKLFGMLEQMLDVSPSAKVLMEIGVMKLEDGDASEAIDYLERALSGADGPQYGREINYNLGIAAQQLEQYARARTYYRRALQEDPSFGRAIKAIGDLYASAIRECGGNMERKDRAVYWLVVDYMERARQADSSLSATVNSAIRTYQPLFPTAEDLFFESWKPGDTYMVNQGCYSWINESTKVRSPN